MVFLLISELLNSCFLKGNLQNVSYNSNTPHVGMIIQFFKLDNFRRSKLWRTRHVFEFLKDDFGISREKCQNST